MNALGKRIKKPRPLSSKDDNEDSVKLTDLDKLYLALAETKEAPIFDVLYYGLDITSIKVLKEYSFFEAKKWLPRDSFERLKHKICDKHFDFHELAQKFKCGDVAETCSKNGIPIIKKEDVSEVKYISWGPLFDCVCEALMKTHDGIKQKVCLRFSLSDLKSLREAEMSILLRHPNILHLYGVIISSSFSPSVALVLEFAEYGNLHESSAQRSVERLCRFTIQIATALELLESKKVIHLLVKSYNCLVVSKDQVKLAGLGDCHFESDLNKKLPVSHTQKEIVYQFAKIFSTYFARYEELTRGTVIAKNIKSRGAYGPLCPSHFCKVFDRCLQTTPHSRPSFSELKQSLVAQNCVSKVRVINSFSAESAEFISCKTGELITLIAKDCHRKDKTAWLGETENRIVGFFKSDYVQELDDYDSMNVPLEIRARGPKAEHAFQKAMQTGKVKVYRGRIMLLGQDRAGKTSLKKSLLGLPFDPSEESTVGVEVHPSTCEIEVDQVKNFTPIERKEIEVSEFGEEIARLIAKDLAQTEANETSITDTEAESDQVQVQVQVQSRLKEGFEDQEHLLSPPNEAKSSSYTDEKSEIAEEVEKPKDKGPVDKSNELELNIDPATLPNDVTDLVVRYLQNLRLEDHIKTKEVILTLWDFAGQHLYYASHSVFLSERAVYLLVYNLNKNLLAEAEPCARQGINDILLDNMNNETNLDNLLSWLVSVHNIRSVDVDANKNLENEATKLCYNYLRPPVIIVGTNADQPFEEVETAQNCIQKSITDKAYVKHVRRKFFAVNNKDENDEGVQKLRQEIMKVLKKEPYMGEEVPLRWFNFERVVGALVAKQTYHIDLDRLLTIIKQVCHVDDEDEITAMMNFYHDLGVIVKHGRTVVLQAQWLIDLFKQLIAVPRFDEANPLYLDCWKELEENGILRTTLVDHVFAHFIERGLFKEDILEMMELYGLIAKFSSGVSTSDIEEEISYFVPTQLRSSPSALREIKPSERDPCPLFLHFPDGFVPHGLFPQLVSRCISWCAENELKKPPQLFNNGARFFVGRQLTFSLILICRKRFIKVVLKRNQCSHKPSASNSSNKMAIEVRTFIEKTLNGFSRDLSWLRNLRYELCAACTHCLQSGHVGSLPGSQSCGQDDCLHFLRVPPWEELICLNDFSGETVTIPGLEKWFELQHSQTEEQEMGMSSEAVHVALDPNFSFKTGTPSSDDVLLIANELGSSWKMVGRALNVPDGVLEQIEEDEPKLFEKCYSVLRTWKETFASDATYQCLARALQHPLVKRPNLAVKYCGLHSCKNAMEAKDV
ncbi:uncharacterized protein [Montipora capricornis]|uniref:uncharacterized protein isoform X2 n=1 Tax=Montipora capricornis TaxID=246305 RepID=UPI0035F203F2